MSRPGRNPSRPIALAVRLGDAGLRDRLIVEITDEPDLVWNEEAADVLITDCLPSKGNEIGMVVLIGDADPAELSPVVRALLPADVSSRTIVSAARLVAEGLLILPDGALERLAAMVAEPAEEDDHTGPSSATLTPREKQVLERLAAGASNKAIARELDVSVHTVKFHVASLLRKLRASGRLEAVGIGLRTGLLMV